MLRKLLTPDIQRIKKHLFHRYDAPTSPPQTRDFLGGIVFAKVVPYPINGKNKVIVVLTVEIWHYGKDVRT